MSDEKPTAERLFAVLETVRCLECGSVYAKPARGGTAAANPGCPECGYVGWLATAAPISEEPPLRRFAAGHQPHHFG